MRPAYRRGGRPGLPLGNTDAGGGTLWPMATRFLCSRRHFGVLAWAVSGFTALDVVSGAVVRATGSGDGCGASWPGCAGSLLPAAPRIETIIEATHRALTGLAVGGTVLLLVLALLLWPPRHAVRRSALATVVLLVVESLLGAALVLFGWVDLDASVARMLVVPLHLTNTFLLLAAGALTAWWGSGAPGPDAVRDDPRRGRLLAGAVALVAIGAVGALNALADTLYPAASLGAGIRAETGAASPFLLQVRMVHPVLAVVGGLLVLWVVFDLRDGATGTAGRRLAGGLASLLLLQALVGIVNVALLTPLELQVLHLLLADGVWILYVVLAVSLLAARSPRPAMVGATR